MNHSKLTITLMALMQLYGKTLKDGADDLAREALLVARDHYAAGMRELAAARNDPGYMMRALPVPDTIVDWVLNTPV